MSLVICDAVGVHNPYGILLLTLPSILPDAIGYAEKIYYKSSNLWNWYLYCHTFHWWEIFMPTWILHTQADKLIHKSSGGWRKNSVYVEILLWIIYIFYFILKFHLLDIL
jgi:hypothetical protein